MRVINSYSTYSKLQRKALSVSSSAVVVESKPSS
jgi:hypothetical protein